MDDKKIIALARKNAAKSQVQAKKPPKVYDATLQGTRHATPDAAGEAERLFKEMKKREF